MRDVPNNSFDIVFSNSVIEHVGNSERQLFFAKEIQRVGKKYWVQTPYKFFPIEPHFLFPMFQFLPFQIQKMIAAKWRYSHYKLNAIADESILLEMENLRLLNIENFKTLFPFSTILFEKYLFLVKSIIAYKV